MAVVDPQPGAPDGAPNAEPSSKQGLTKSIPAECEPLMALAVPALRALGGALSFEKHLKDPQGEAEGAAKSITPEGVQAMLNLGACIAEHGPVPAEPPRHLPHAPRGGSRQV
jgi:hypothetical protein